MYRTQPEGKDIDGKVKNIMLDDRSYKHRYRINYEQSQKERELFWTGTSYQVNLDYKKDFMTTQAINLFNDQFNVDGK